MSVEFETKHSALSTKMRAMSEVAQLQLIALSIVGVGILILLFIEANFVRVIGICCHRPRVVFAHVPRRAAVGLAASG